jgi:hypothetical protein
MSPKPARRTTWLALCVAAAWFFPHALGAAPPARLHSLLVVPTAHGSARIHRFRLPLAGLRVSYVDLEYKLPLADALGDADLVVNGGYWGWIDEQRRTLIGLLVVAGKPLSPLRQTLKGGVLSVHRGRANIVASHGYVAPPGADLAVQCRPRLIVDRAVVPELNATARAARTGVCVREGGTTLGIYVTDPEEPGATLEAFAHWLLADGCDNALNLDGGPSTAAAFREQGTVVRLGPGERLPYALRFKY